MVERAKEYIRAGDAFQVVLSQRFEGGLPAAGLSRLYARCARVNPSPFPVLSRLRGLPDRLLLAGDPGARPRGRGHGAPDRGARARGATPAEDRAHADDLLADPKERAEHLMLLVSRPQRRRARRPSSGRVRVTDSFFLEYYSQVMPHRLERGGPSRGPPRRARCAGGGLLRGHGVRRRRSGARMEIIDELERDKRGPYAGLHRLFRRRRRDDTCIVLRTAVVKDGACTSRPARGVVYDRRFRVRAHRVRQQGESALPRRRGRRALRQPRPPRPVAARCRPDGRSAFGMQRARPPAASRRLVAADGAPAARSVLAPGLLPPLSLRSIRPGVTGVAACSVVPGRSAVGAEGNGIQREIPHRRRSIAAARGG